MIPRKGGGRDWPHVEQGPLLDAVHIDPWDLEGDLVEPGPG